MNVTEFLLARIAEDEATARDAEIQAHRRYQGQELVDVMSDRSLQVEDGWLSVGYLRVLAECEAKRRIVQMCGPIAQPVRFVDGYHVAHQDALRALAAVYSDHPDYDPEWRLDTPDDRGCITL